MNIVSLKKNFPAIGVVILGAGASSRMGQPKLLLPWGDTSVIGHLIRQWQTLGAGQITVVCQPADRELGAELDRLAFPSQNRIANPEPEQGMFSSILCAANWTGWNNEIAVWAIVLGDQPHLRLETLRTVLEFHARHPAAICQPEFGGHARHPVLLPRPAFEELKQTQAKTLKTFLKQISCPLVKCPIADPGLALDLDTPEDYKQAKIHLSGT
jgi:molybdenum cofactor cytidylyltransferase